MPIKLKNNATGFLATAISASDTGLVLQAGNGAAFSALSAGEYFYATLVSAGGTLEVVKVTARVGDTMTVVRAQEGSTAAGFAPGSRLEQRVTAQSVIDAVGDAAVAATIGFTPTGGISATNVQAAIAELDSEAAKSAALAASTGSSLVGFQQAGSGAVVRTAQSKMRDVVSVLDFGADPTGATNSATAFTSAIATGKLVLVPKGTYLRGVTSTTYATDHLLGILRVGEKTTVNSSDPQVIVAREVDSSIGGNGHCFSDSSNINRPGTISYNSYDARVTWSGSHTYGHYAAFQSGAVYNCSGTTTDWFHFFAGLQVTNGTITNNRGLTFQPPVLSGSGSVAQNFAVYVDSLPEYTGVPSTGTTNYALYSDGAARVWANGTATFRNVLVANGQGAVGARVHINEEPDVAARFRLQQQSYNYFDFVIPASQTYMQISQAGSSGAAVLTLNAGGGGVAGFGTYLPKASDLGGASVHYHFNTVSAGTGADFYLSSNAYYNGAWKHSATASAGQIALIGNSIRFNVAISGSADTDVNGTGTWTEGGRWQGNGYLLIGYTTSNGAYNLQVNSQIFATNATIATSDGRYKEDVADIDNALGVISSLRPVTFKWKTHDVHRFDVGQTDIGFIAQEVQASIAGKDYAGQIVKSNTCEMQDGSSEEFLGLADSKLVPLLVKAMQEQQAMIESLQARIAALEL